VDRSLGSRTVAKVLRDAGYAVEIHDDHFEQDTADDVWLRAIGRRNWVVLSKDDYIRRRAAEIGAIRAASVCIFVLGRGNLTGQQMAEAFVKAMPQIERVLSKYRPPLVCTVSCAGSVQVFETADSRKEPPVTIHPKRKPTE
jgi:hypothetical protein